MLYHFCVVRGYRDIRLYLTVLGYCGKRQGRTGCADRFGYSLAACAENFRKLIYGGVSAMLFNELLGFPCNSERKLFDAS